MEHQEEFCNPIFNKCPLPLIVLEKDSLKFLSVNSASISAFGYSEDELLTMKFIDIIPEEGRSYLVEQLKKVSPGIDIHLDLQNITKSGKKIEMKIIATQIKFNNKQCILKIATDVSEQKKSEAIIKEQEMYFQNLFNNSPFAVVLLNENEQIVKTSNKFHQLFKYNPGEALYKTLKELIIPDHYISEHNNLIKKVKNGESFQLETKRKTKDNKLIDVFAVKFPIMMNKEFKGSYAFFLDISQEVSLKNELKKLYTELEKRVSERTKELELAYESLKDINHEFEEINKSKDKLISIISHDLRNPISTIVSSSKIMMQNINQFQKEELKNFTEIINNSSVKVYEQLNELVEWSKQKEKKVTFKPKKINLYEFVVLSFELMKEIACQKKITLDNKIDKNIQVKADPILLRSIIQNLVTNSLKFTPKKGSITISAYRKNKSFIEISIKDTGIGMEETIKNKLFSEEAAITKPGETKTSGLGLLLVKDFVEKNNGKIWIESEPNKGTTFYFTIPNYEKK